MIGSARIIPHSRIIGNCTFVQSAVPAGPGHDSVAAAGRQFHACVEYLRGELKAGNVRFVFLAVEFGPAVRRDLDASLEPPVRLELDPVELVDRRLRRPGTRAAAAAGIFLQLRVRP